jgi:hypothetical protein
MSRKGFGDQLTRVVWKAVRESYTDLRVEGKAKGLIRLVEALEVGIPGYKGLSGRTKRVVGGSILMP